MQKDKSKWILLREVVWLIVKEIKMDNATVFIDDSYIAKTEEERKARYELFNSIGCEIINSSID